jgi:hypothetical protein
MVYRRDWIRTSASDSSEKPRTNGSQRHLWLVRLVADSTVASRHAAKKTLQKLFPTASDSTVPLH